MNSADKTNGLIFIAWIAIIMWTGWMSMLIAKKIIEKIDQVEASRECVVYKAKK